MCLKKYLMIIMVSICFIACQDDDQQFGNIVAPSNLSVNVEVVGADDQNPSGDGSGLVNFSVTAANAINYKFFFGDNTEALDSDGIIQKTYNLTGVNNYTVTIVANGVAGVSSSVTTEVTVRSDFEDPDTRDLLTGGDGSSKVWYYAFQENAHLGVGPPEGTDPSFFAASPNQLADCLYDDVFTFSLDGNDITFTHENQGVSFFNQEFNTVGGGGGPDDQCLDFDTSGTKFVSLSSAGSIFPEDLTTGTAFNIGDGGFMGYFINSSTYEVLEISENTMKLRALSGSAGPLAWYHIFTTNPDGSIDE